MNIFSALLSRLGLRAGTPAPDDYWYTPFGYTMFSAAGVPVTGETAFRSATILACVLVKSKTVASLPLGMFRSAGRARFPAPEHRVHDLLRYPNSWQTSMEFRFQMQGYLELWSNAYAEILPGPRGFADQLIPIHPDHVTVRQLPSRRLVYDVTEQGQRRPLSQDQMFHLRWFPLDGLSGTAALKTAREVFGLALALQDFAANWIKNDGTPSVGLEHPGKLSDRAQGNLKGSFQKSQTGKKRGSAFVAEEGMKIVRIGQTNVDAQFVEARYQIIEEVCRVFNTPPHKVAHLLRATFSNIEEQNIEWATDTIRPICVNWEQAIDRDLLLPEERGQFFTRHTLEGLLRGNLKSRYDAYAVGRNWGWLATNDIRALEDMNPIDGGDDDYLRPMNMNLASDPTPAQQPSRPALPGREEEGEEAERRARKLLPSLTQ